MIYHKKTVNVRFRKTFGIAETLCVAFSLQSRVSGSLNINKAVTTF
jgi:hypothetical protein